MLLAITAAHTQTTPAAVQADGSPEQNARFAEWRLHPLSGSGPYRATRVEEASLPTRTIYRPADLAGVKARLPIVAFGNGGCRNTSVEFTAFLAEIASHGYLVVAAGRNDVDFAMGMAPGTSRNGMPTQVLDPGILTRGVDWAIAENSRKASPYHGKIDTKAIAYMGQSCGGYQALTASRDPRTTTTVVLNSGYFKNLPPGLPHVQLPQRASWSELHAPIAYFIGGPKDAAYTPSRENFAEIESLPVFKAQLPVGHTGAYPGPDMRWTKAVIAWLDWQLKANEQAKGMFVGAQCGLCTDSNWFEVVSKNLK
jgi:dienelactone hydrolase